MERRHLSVDPVELLDQHRRLTSRLARRYGRFEAEDLASEALVRSLRRPAPDGARQPWLERILRNLVVDRARRSSRDAAQSVALYSAAAGECGATPEDQLLQAERCRAVQRALPTMPSGLRDAVVGRFYEDHDYDTVAAARGISPATARTRVHRALASLRLSLGRLRAAIPWPQLAGVHGSATTALLPAALSAALIVPSLVPGPSPSLGPKVEAVRVADASPAPRRRPPASEPTTRSEAARVPPTTMPVKVTRAVPPRTGREQPLETTGRPEGQPAAVTKYDFENDEVEGTLAGPDSIDVFGTPVVKHASLIEIRREFVGEIAKMLEEF